MNDIYAQFDKAFASVMAYVIFKDDKPYGRAVFKHGNQVTAYFQVWGAPMQKGIARGGGYDRASAAIRAAAAKLAPSPDFPPYLPLEPVMAALAGYEGESWQRQLEVAGFTVQHVI